jgi:hypothetical protein
MSNIMIVQDRGDQGFFAKAINRVVKEFRGKNRPFLSLVVEDDGQVTVLSNMDNFGERIRLLEQTTIALMNQFGPNLKNQN